MTPIPRNIHAGDEGKHHIGPLENSTNANIPSGREQPFPARHPVAISPTEAAILPLRSYFVKCIISVPSTAPMYGMTNTVFAAISRVT